MVTPRPNSSIQRVFTIDGEDVGRVSLDRVVSYLEAHRPDLVEDFSSMAMDMTSDYGELSEWLVENKIPEAVAKIASDKHASAPQLQYSTIGEVILQTGRDLKIKDDDVLALVADLDIADTFGFAKETGAVREWKKGMQPLTESWVSWTSCFATADRLFNLLKSGDSASQSAAGGDAVQLQKCMWSLCGAIQDSLAKIFKVKIGASDHSFSIIVQSGRCELLQSFAGESGESLVMNAQANKVFSTSEICAHLIDICNPRLERKESSEALFDGEVMLKGDEDLWPTLALAWEGAPLPIASEVLKIMRAKISKNLEILKSQKIIK